MTRFEIAQECRRLMGCVHVPRHLYYPALEKHLFEHGDALHPALLPLLRATLRDAPDLLPEMFSNTACYLIDDPWEYEVLFTIAPETINYAYLRVDTDEGHYRRFANRQYITAAHYFWSGKIWYKLASPDERLTLVESVLAQIRTQT